MNIYIQYCVCVLCSVYLFTATADLPISDRHVNCNTYASFKAYTHHYNVLNVCRFCVMALMYNILSNILLILYTYVLNTSVLMTFFFCLFYMFIHYAYLLYTTYISVHSNTSLLRHTITNCKYDMQVYNLSCIVVINPIRYI